MVSWSKPCGAASAERMVQTSPDLSVSISFKILAAWFAFICTPIDLMCKSANPLRHYKLQRSVRKAAFSLQLASNFIFREFDTCILTSLDHATFPIQNQLAHPSQIRTRSKLSEETSCICKTSNCCKSSNDVQNWSKVRETCPVANEIATWTLWTFELSISDSPILCSFPTVNHSG